MAIALLIDLILFVVAFLLHVVSCRLFKSSNHSKNLIAIFFFVLCTGLVIFGDIGFAVWGERLVWPIGYIYACILFFSLTASYLITFSAIEAESPSIMITLKVAQAGPCGLIISKLFETLNDDVLLKPRINDLVNEKLVYESEGKYKLTKRGTLFIRIVIFYRDLICVGKGG
ncbi:MAG: hypothetical protein KJ880_06670 [Candidatus Omnitrophica bacterium]|nr:hypothetical protein [Candidatus Omnitrophota bacterium]MBU1870365.1 hypothetical protein [Candidatus Omnitrophota bacterium]